MVVLVTGSGGQLGQALQSIASEFAQMTFVFADSASGDITSLENLDKLFSKHQPDFCINAAAYTAVDRAESELEKAHLINVEGARNLAICCKKFQTTLIHISTDFVFDGQKKAPYNELDQPNPTGVYGRTKLEGEQAILEILPQSYIVRTSWVYSGFGNNFMKTMLRLAAERDTLSIVDDQIGTPTHAVDLARALLTIVASGKTEFGVYHFSNEGETSWFGFAKKIFDLKGISITVNPIPTSGFPTPAKRPFYSVLDKSKIKTVFALGIPEWEHSLEKELGQLPQ